MPNRLESTLTIKWEGAVAQIPLFTILYLLLTTRPAFEARSKLSRTAGC